MSLARTARKNAQGPTAVTNDFHQVRLSEYRRDYALSEQAALPSQVSVSYFVPTLQSICADLLAKNFNTMVEVDALQTDYPKLFEMVVGKVSAAEEEVPLSVSVPRIADEAYWKRACETRWSLGQISKYAKERLVGKETGWKQLFLERALCDYLLSLRSGAGQVRGAPSELRSLRGVEISIRDDAGDESIDSGLSDAEAAHLEKLCFICKDYIHCLDLPCQYTHLDLYQNLFSFLPKVFDLRLSYGASNAGVGFHRRMIGFSDDDARGIAQLLKRYTALRSLRLPFNRLSSLQIQCICASLVGNTTLRVLDLSSNQLKDDALKAISVIISQPNFLIEELYLNNNSISKDGSLALAHAMEMNKSLKVLSLAQNRIPDGEGGSDLIHSVVDHPALEILDLGSNCLGINFLKALHEVLPRLTKLSSLKLSGNRYFGMVRTLALGGGGNDNGDVAPGGEDVEGSMSLSVNGLLPPLAKQSGTLLLQAVKANQSLRHIDIRMCHLDEEDVHAIEKVTYERVRQLDRGETVERETESRKKILQLVEEKVSRKRGDINPFMMED